MSRAVILVVEDESLLRLYAASILEDLSFDVILAVSAEQAIEKLASDPSIAVVFTDIDLGRGMDGIALVNAVQRRWPPVGLIVASGHFLERPPTLPGAAQYLPKPYSQHDIASALKALSL